MAPIITWLFTNDTFPYFNWLLFARKINTFGWSKNCQLRVHVDTQEKGAEKVTTGVCQVGSNWNWKSIMHKAREREREQLTLFGVSYGSVAWEGDDKHRKIDGRKQRRARVTRRRGRGRGREKGNRRERRMWYGHCHFSPLLSRLGQQFTHILEKIPT